nr:BCCT family transporter [Piscibacillus salipiscarius]
MDTKHFKNPVFYVSAIVIALLVIIGAIMPKQFGEVANRLFLFTTSKFGWFYLIAVFVLVIFLAVLAFSRYGKIRLGGEEERPDYPFFYMDRDVIFSRLWGGTRLLGCCGADVSLFRDTIEGVEPLTEEAARLAMGYSFFHWGVSQWSVFAIVGLVVAFMQFRRRDAGLISKAMEPVTGHKPVVTNTIDTLAVIATVMGVATSLGLGVLQINGGLSTISDIPSAVWVQLLIIVVMFVAYMTSTFTGLDKGIKYLSNINLGLCLLLLVFVLIFGPTIFILNAFTLGIGDYISNFINYSLRLQPYKGGTWVRDWTVFYWAWAIAWSPLSVHLWLAYQKDAPSVSLF